MITGHAIRNAIEDALEQVCENTQEYYAVNHTSLEHQQELETFLVNWLKKIGIEVII